MLRDLFIKILIYPVVGMFSFFASFEQDHQWKIAPSLVNFE